MRMNDAIMSIISYFTQPTTTYGSERSQVQFQDSRNENRSDTRNNIRHEHKAPGAGRSVQGDTVCSAADRSAKICTTRVATVMDRHQTGRYISPSLSPTTPGHCQQNSCLTDYAERAVFTIEKTYSAVSQSERRLFISQSLCTWKR